MLNDYLITRDVITYLNKYITQSNSATHLSPFIKEIEAFKHRQNVSYEQWWGLLEHLSSLDNTPALGITIGSSISVQDCGVLGYLFKTSRNIDDALKCFKRYQALIYAGSKAELVFKDKSIVSLIWPPDLGYSSQLSDSLLLSAMVKILRELVAPASFTLSEVCFTQAIPYAEIPLYCAFFGCDVKQCQPILSLSFDSTLLETHIPHQDTTLHAILGQQAEELLKHIPETDNFMVTLRDTIMRSLHEGFSEANCVAKKMGLSERTLHRRLHEKHRLYRDVLKEIRKSMAIKYLGEAKLTLAEIALLLGYSEQSTFTRAFKTWHGLSPLQYRKRYSSF